MSTYQELVAQKAELDRLQADLEKQIAETLRNERAGVIHQIKTLMAENGITAADLASGRPGRPPKIGIAEPGTTRKVAAKYCDKDTGESWSGRGLKPKWLTAALENGRSLVEFAV
ncbi:H-NS histone family protein [uncultured Sphaerotilus sp.]|uniref:H-NS histone family protein n=1 Tax=uncultured Sphaerotilus sp. TaxID=474984 RepID=UPI0030CA44F3